MLELCNINNGNDCPPVAPLAFVLPARGIPFLAFVLPAHGTPEFDLPARGTPCMCPLAYLITGIAQEQFEGVG